MADPDHSMLYVLQIALMAFIMYKNMVERNCVSIGHVAVPPWKRRMGLGKLMVRNRGKV